MALGAENKMLTVSEAARMLHVHPNTLRKWCDSGVIPSYRIGRRGDRRVRIADVERYLTSSLRTEEDDYRILFDSTVDGLVVVDARTKEVLLANRTFARMSGFDSPDELVGLNALKFLSRPEDRFLADVICSGELFERRVGQRYEFCGITRSGTERWVEVIGVPIRYRGRKAGLVTLRDITDRKKAAGRR